MYLFSMGTEQDFCECQMKSVYRVIPGKRNIFLAWACRAEGIVGIAKKAPGWKVAFQ
jgi:hypothetical protein